MAIAAPTAGGHTTLDLLIGIAVLIWALAGVAALVSWLTRSARWKRRGRLPGLVGALRAHLRPPTTRGGGADDSTSTPSAPTDAPSRGMPSTAAAESRASTITRAAPASAQTPAGVIVNARVSPETLEPLGQRVDNSRRLAVARACLGDALTALPGDRWFVERNVVFAAHPIPFLILGESGVFAMWGAPGPLQWRDLPFYGEMAANVKMALPGYAGLVHAGICRAFEPEIKPRWWCRSGEPNGAWTMGLDWVTRWLEHFGPEHGLGATDIERLRAMAGPHWGRPVTDVPLSAHIPSID
jgi:hypothetical protein